MPPEVTFRSGGSAGRTARRVSSARIGDNGPRPAPPVGTRRPRLLPGALIASGLIVAAACTTLAVTAGPPRESGQTCATGQQWVTVHPAVVDISQWAPVAGASAGSATANGPTLAGCLDTSQLPANPGTRTDSRG